jgi:hypothetical protein
MNNKVIVFCSGGCGRSVTLRKSRIIPADFYVCNSRADGNKCTALVMAQRPADMLAGVEFNAAAHFTGITFKVPDEEERASLARAHRLKRYALGVADRAELQAVKGGKSC